MSPTQIILDVDPTIFRAGPFLLTATGLAIGLALVSALFLAFDGLRRQGIADSVLPEVALRAIPCGLLGGRIFHVADNWTYYGVHPLAIVEPGGFSLGGVILVGGLAAARYLSGRDVPLGQFFDALAPGLLAAMIVGPIGSLVSGDLLGRPAETFLTVKYINQYSFDQRGMFVYPVAAYVIVWFLVGSVIYRCLPRQALPPGVAAAFVLVWLGIGQFWQEFFRSVPDDWFGLSQGQLLGLIIALAAAAGIVRQIVRHKVCSLPDRAVQPSR